MRAVWDLQAAAADPPAEALLLQAEVSRPKEQQYSGQGAAG